jgi:hypothetical protein
MAITEKNLHTKIKTVEKSGSGQVIKILYPTNYDSDVLLTDHKNTNIPSSAVTVKDVIDSVGSLAFKSSIDDATTSSSGLMSATDKQKIDMIDLSTGAVGTITSVQVNGTSIASKGVANIPLANGTKTAGAILTTSTVTSATGYTASPVINGVPYYKNTIYDDATQSKHGLMTAADKTKLDGIATGANNITVDSTLSATSTNPVQNKVLTSATGVSTLLNQLTIGKDTPVDDDYFISQYVGGGTTTTTYHRRSVSALANYVKSKITIPTSLKNPHALVVKFNGGTTEGTSMFTYDGSAAKSINITPSSIGAAASSHTHTDYYGTNESRTANTVLAAPDGSNGSASFRKLTMNDIPRNYLHYYSSSMYTKGYYKIKIKSLANWMLSIYVRIYQKYQNTDLVISGYNYYTAKEHWYSPKATILGSSLDSMQIVFGYDADDYLWFTIPASDYSGIDIVDVVSGFNNPINNFNKLFEITYIETEPTTAQSKVTAYRPYLKSDFDIAPITIHLNNTTAHITAAERTTWNAKQNALKAGTDYLTPASISSTYLKKNPDGTNNLIGTNNKINSTYLPAYTASSVGLDNVTNDKQVKGLSEGTTENHIVTWGANGYTVKDSGYTIATSVPPDARFTDTTSTLVVGSKNTSSTNEAVTSSTNSIYLNLFNGKTLANSHNIIGTGATTVSSDTAGKITINTPVVTLSSIGAAPSSHSHTKSQIEDFPTSMPASDVYAWAKASAKPSYVWSEIGSKPTGDTSTAGITKLYDSVGEGTDGTITRTKLTELFDKTIDNDELNEAITSVIDTIDDKLNDKDDYNSGLYATINYVESEDGKLQTDINDKYDLLTAKDAEIIQMIKDTNDTLDISDYIRFVDGLIEMGYSSNTYIQKIDNNKIAFYQGDTIIASIHDNKIESNNIKVTNSIIIGDDTNGFFELSMDSTAGLVMR